VYALNTHDYFKSKYAKITIIPVEQNMSNLNTSITALIFICLIIPASFAAPHPGMSEADEAYSQEHFEEAAKLYRRDAELGMISAQVNLAFLYMDGQGVNQNYQEAANWFRRAAENGNNEAQYNLAQLYQEGKGVNKNLKYAYQWFEIAGSTQEKQKIADQLSEQDLTDAQRNAEEWNSRHGK
jgi:TPR repeat protein